MGKIIKVTLRQKPLKDKKRASLYLDFYPGILNHKTNKLTRREYLGGYVYTNPVTPAQKNHNQEMTFTAENYRLRRQSEVNRMEIYSEWERQQIEFSEKQKASFNEYFRKIVDSKTGSNRGNWLMALTYFENIFGQFVCFRDTDIALCNRFRSELLKMTSIKGKKTEFIISQNTAQSYYNRFRSVLKQAYREGYLRQDLRLSMEPIKTQETKRVFLTLDELNTLYSTDIGDDLIKRAALFSALTGLRFCDVRDLKWKDLECYPGYGWFLHYRQNKTKAIEQHPISDQAVKILGPKQDPKTRVFEGLTYSDKLNVTLNKWLAEAGINKRITWHCLRHTYATIQLSQGVGLSTIRRLLGHRNERTTQIYTKVLDQDLWSAANSIVLKKTEPGQ